MLTVGDKLPEFSVIGVKPGETDPDQAFEPINETTFPGKWKIIMFYPKDFTFVCPTEIVAYDKLNEDFADRDAVLMMGSTDNEFCKLAWKQAHTDLAKVTSWMFADTQRGYIDGQGHWQERGLAEQLGIFSGRDGAALRATFIVDPDNVIQHVSVNNLDVGRNADEAVRILDACQTQELCACNREVGGSTLG